MYVKKTEIMETKICTKCGEEKQLNDFHKKSRSKDGFTSQCKTCRCKYTLDYSSNNKDKKRISDSNYYKNNKVKVNQYKLNWYHENKDRLRDSVLNRQRKSYHENKDLHKMRYNQAIESVNDWYVELILTRVIDVSSSTLELIEAKRQIIKINRLLKNKKS
jgi:hypothetical protein